jgi:hypothetical protein
MPRAAFVVALAALAAVLAAPVTRAIPANRDDALAAEVARWSAFLRTNPATGDLWKQIKQGSEPALARTQKALDERRPLLAWLRFAPAHEGLAAGRYLGERTAGQRTNAGEFEAEWKRMGGVLRPHLSPPSPDALEGVHPAFLRALGEAALPQARVYYDASLDYGRSTTPESGLYYLGAAQSARDFAELIRRLSAPAGPAAPRLRSPAGEIDALEGEMLAAYRPPLSIDKHREFIGASAALKEARELEAAGLRHGALLRYLQAALRFGSLRAGAPPAPAQLAKRLDEAESRLAAGVDHSLMRVFLQAGRADLDEQGPAGAVNAAAVVNDVLPRYLAALGPAPPRAARSEPRVTVTLVRWPYT